MSKTMMYALQMQKERQEAKAAEKNRDAQNAMDILKIELQKEENEAQATREFTFGVMQSKEKELSESLTALGKLAGLSEEDVSSGIKAISTDIMEGGKANVNVLKQNVNILDDRIKNIQGALTDIRRQQRDYNLMYNEFAGENKVLDELEFQDLLRTGVSEKGWKYGGAGAQASYNVIPHEQRAKLGIEMTQAVIKQERLDETINAQYQMLQTFFERAKSGSEKDSPPVSWKEHAEENFSYIDPVSGEKVAPDEAIVEYLAAMAMDPDAESFLINIYQWPDEKGGQQIRDMISYNPKFRVLMNNIERALGRKNQLLGEGNKDFEFYSSIYDEWQATSSGAYDITEAFSIFQQNRSKYTLDEQKEILKFISIDWNNGNPVDQEFEDFYYDFYGDPNDPNAPYRQKDRFKLKGDKGTKRYYVVDGIQYEYDGKDIITTKDGKDIGTSGYLTDALTIGGKSLGEAKREEKKKEVARINMDWTLGRGF